MPNYATSKVYKIVCNLSNEAYIGSTTVSLSQRLALHKANLGCSSRQIIERGDYKIVLIEDYPCERKEQLAMRERHWYDIMDCINKNRPHTTLEEKKEYQKRYISEYQKTDKNKEYHRQYHRTHYVSKKMGDPELDGV